MRGLISALVMTTLVGVGVACEALTPRTDTSEALVHLEGIISEGPRPATSVYGAR